MRSTCTTGHCAGNQLHCSGHVRQPTHLRSKNPYECVLPIVDLVAEKERFHNSTEACADSEAGPDAALVVLLLQRHDGKGKRPG